MPRIIWPKPLEVAQPELLPFAHCFWTISLDIKPVSLLGGEHFWTEPFTSGSLAEIWPWLIVTENHYQLTATWWYELVSLIPAPDGHISVNTVTTGTNWHSQLKDNEVNREGNWTFLFILSGFFEALWTGIYTTFTSQAIFTLHSFSKLCHFHAAWFSTAWSAISV